MINGAMYNRFTLPVVTGTPVQPHSTKPLTTKSDGKSFKELLNAQMQQSSSLAFSTHAAARVQERNIAISSSEISRLNEGLRIAGEKGLNDTLILIDQTAFIVNIKNSTVITAVNGEELRGNVFTNIDGTVII